MQELAEQQAPALVDASVGEIMLNAPLLEQVNELAKVMAKSQVTIPKHLQGSEGDCYAVVMQAVQWRMNPFAVAQKTHLVNGTLGYEAQLVNAVVQSSGMIRGTFKYEYRGEANELECRVGARLTGDEDITWGEWLKFSDVTIKNSPLWKTNPKQQLGYLQVKNFARLFCPAAILGVYTPDELQEIDTGEREIGPKAQVSDLNEAIKPAQEATTEKPPIEGEKVPDGGVPAMAADELNELLADISGVKTAAAMKGMTAHCKKLENTGRLTDDQKQLLLAAIGKRSEELKAAEAGA